MSPIIFHMFLEVGNSQQINEPSAEKIIYHLGHLPPSAPFVILTADDELFIQATPEGDQYRVELRRGKHQVFTTLSLADTEQVFLAFRRWDEAAVESFGWTPLSIWNDRYSIVAPLTLFGLILALALWSIVRSFLRG